MLATPKTKLLSGIDNPELVVVKNFPDYQNRNNLINQSLRTIASDLGYDLSTLRGFMDCAWQT